MKGNVIGFDPDTNAGAISGHDGQRYDFTTSDWHNPSRPRHGDLVDFVAEGQRAAQIYLIEPEYVAPGFAQFYVSPSGRISRYEFWMKSVLPIYGTSFVLYLLMIAAIGTALSDILLVIFYVFWLVTLWPSIATLAKRIHDRDKSGWLVLLWYIPSYILLIIIWGIAIVATAQGAPGALVSAVIFTVVLGLASLGVAIWFFIEFGCMRGTVGGNQYGADPLRGG